MVFITGDKHGYLRDVERLCDRVALSADDILIILGDAGWNFYLDERDRHIKNRLAKLKPTIFCIHGNHECRPEHINTYKTKEWHGGTVWYEEKYPNLLFARDGDIYDFAGKKCLVAGGAYSVDKYWRLARNVGWWDDEQPSDEIKARVEEACRTKHIDVILSHTCPLKYQPVDTFIPGIDQSTVDNSTEEWLDKIEEMVDYQKWYCGHYHIERVVDKLEFLFNGIELLDDNGDMDV